VSLTLSGCDSSAINDRVQNFDKALISSASSIETYYEQINDLQRTAYFDDLRFSPALRMSDTKPGALVDKSNPSGPRKEISTGLLNRFSPDDIEARVSAIEALGKFGEGLAALSDSDAPDRTEKSIDDIGDELQSISTHMNTLTGKKSADFGDYAGPITTLGGIAAKYWLKSKQDDAVRKSIEEDECQ